jgi:uncharacterized membrane protein
MYGMRNIPLSLEEINKQHKPIRNVNRREKLSSLEQVAMWITDHVGSMGFFLLIFFWTTIWLGWNVLGPREVRFDPYPAFVLWLFISNLIQLFLMPLLLIGQNLQGKYSEARAQVDFEVNMKAEKEIESILTHLENQDEILHTLLEKIDKK